MYISPSPPAHLTRITDLEPSAVRHLLDLAFSFKVKHRQGIKQENVLKGASVALVFEKPSLRTKVAFETAVASLGGTPIFLPGIEIFTRADGMKREETDDIVHALERYCDMIVARVHRHESIQAMAACSSVPVINGLCDKHHPTQALGDLMTILWHKPNVQELTVAFFGDGNNVATSLMQICAMMGLHFVHAGPPSHAIPAEEWDAGKAYAQHSGSTLRHTDDPFDAATNADVLYTDTFVSMGDEAETNERIKIFAPYRVTGALMKRAKPDALFLHCLPAHRGEEVDADVIDGPQSKVFDLAECRMHIAKALLKFFLVS